MGGSNGTTVFQCYGFGDCRMVFTRSEHLARHVRKHTGERPFQCHCVKSFSRLDNLRQHCQTVHSDTPELNEEVLRKLTVLHANLAASAAKNQQAQNKVTGDATVSTWSTESASRKRKSLLASTTDTEDLKRRIVATERSHSDTDNDSRDYDLASTSRFSQSTPSSVPLAPVPTLRASSLMHNNSRSYPYAHPPGRASASSVSMGGSRISSMMSDVVPSALPSGPLAHGSSGWSKSHASDRWTPSMLPPLSTVSHAPYDSSRADAFYGHRWSPSRRESFGDTYMRAPAPGRRRFSEDVDTQKYASGLAHPSSDGPSLSPRSMDSRGTRRCSLTDYPACAQARPTWTPLSERARDHSLSSSTESVPLPHPRMSVSRDEGRAKRYESRGTISSAESAPSSSMPHRMHDVVSPGAGLSAESATGRPFYARPYATTSDLGPRPHLPLVSVDKFASRWGPSTMPLHHRPLHYQSEFSTLAPHAPRVGQSIVPGSSHSPIRRT